MITEGDILQIYNEVVNEINTIGLDLMAKQLKTKKWHLENWTKWPPKMITHWLFLKNLNKYYKIINGHNHNLLINII